MKTKIKLSLIASFAVGAGALWLTTSGQPVTFANEVTSTNELTSPRGLYLQNCARCHGADGKANTPKGQQLDATDLTTLSKSTASISRTIKNGRGDMPAFGERLTAKQIASIAGYVRSL